MRISFIVLAHENPEVLKRLVTPLLRSGSDVFLHYDASSSYKISDYIEGWGLATLEGKLYLVDAVKVVWGEWSIVQATLNCLWHAKNIGYNTGYYMLISGSCMPVKPIEQLRKHLASNDFDYIECVNANNNRWVIDGLQEERWKHFHFINWRYHPKLFSLSYHLQSLFRVNRQIPGQHIPHMGSQWWCLRKSTIEKIIALLEMSPDLLSFYKHTWIPDEFFFQTLVANLVPRSEISAESLTYYQFNSGGVPRIFFDDDFSEILQIRELFARKISPRATQLKDKLTEISSMTLIEFEKYKVELSDELKTGFLGNLDLIKEETVIARTGLATSKMMDEEYLQGLAFPLVVFCSLNIEVRREISKKLIQDTRFQFFGEIFGEASRFCGDYEQTIFKNHCSNKMMANHFWLSFLAEVSKGVKPAVLILGSDICAFVDLLKWKRDCNIVLVNSDWNWLDSDVTRDYEKLYAFQQEQKLFLDAKLLISESYASISEIEYVSENSLDNLLNRLSR